MTQPDLFPDAFQDSPYIEFVRRHGIFTHRNDECPEPWLALAFEASKKFLAPRIGVPMEEASEDEPVILIETDPVMLIAMYGALLESAGFIREAATERDAVLELAYALRLDGREGI